MTEHFDVLVVGAGAVGSATMWRSALRGARVLGLDRYPQAHDRGSSHGQTRAIRQAYFEHPDYVPLLRMAYQWWADLEQASGQRLFHQVGLLEVGPAQGEVIPGVLRSAAQHKLAIDVLTVAEARTRFPAFRFFDDDQIVVETNAGFLRVEACVQQQLNQAIRLGAQWRQETVQHWRVVGREIEVVTDQLTYRADRLVLAAGPWSQALLADLQLPLQVLRKQQYWRRAGPKYASSERALPVFFFEDAEGFFYGFPEQDHLGIKIAEHSGGEQIATPSEDVAGPGAEHCDKLDSFVRRRMPTPARTPTATSVCYYTMTPDQHFVVDRHPHWPQVIFAAGLSGHGFKFAPLLGEALTQLALSGVAIRETRFLSMQRFGR